MLVQSGLYYPYIHIRRDPWLKLAALYWKRMDRIVPQDYPTEDSHTVQALTDDLGFIKSHRPGQAAVDTSRQFLKLLEARGTELASQLGVQPSALELSNQAGRPRDGGLSNSGTIGYIFAEKLSQELVEALTAAGLAFGASKERDGRRRLSINFGEADWIGMDSRLAAVYMTVLTRHTAHHFDLTPVTDVPIAHIAMDGMGVDEVASAIIGHPVSRSERQMDLEHRVAILAIQSVIPRNIGLVDVSEIIRFRKQTEDELGAFQNAVIAAGAELSMLPADVDASTLRDRVIEVTEQQLLKPQRELEKALRLFGLETAKSVTTLQVPLAASAGAPAAAATVPVVGFATGAAAALVAFGAAEHTRRRELRKQNLAANYLMELRSGLTPAGVIRRQLRSRPAG